MVMLTISANDQLIDHLRELASQRGVSVETLAQEALEQFVSNAVSRRGDPIVGLFDSGRDDIVDQHEEMLRGWKPD
jgi:predicted transcriptional regulator